MDLVAALEAQHLQHIRENCPLGEEESAIGDSTGSLDNSTATAGTSSPKESRRNEKKRWKNWSWKYSPGGKTTSIEEEDFVEIHEINDLPASYMLTKSLTSSSPKSTKHVGKSKESRLGSPKKTSRHSSPNSSPKHKKSEAAASGSSNSNLSMSPIRRSKNRNASAANGNGGMGSIVANRMIDVRSSAGARLCQMLDDSQDESGDELQALLANGRPASVHIVQMSSGVSLLNNDMFDWSWF